MSPIGAEMVAGAEVKLAGAPLKPALAALVLEVRVQHTLMLPSSFTLAFRDPALENVDDTAFAIGSKVEILLAAPDARGLTSVLSGEVVAIESEYGRLGATLIVRGYDASHKLHLVRRSQTFQQMTVADIARKVIQSNGLRAGTIEAAGGTLEFVQQSAETDWQLIWRLARAVGLEVVPESGTIHLRRPAATGPATTLEWGHELISFRPRLTGMQQAGSTMVMGWDPKSGKALSGTGTPQRTSTPKGAAAAKGPRSEMPGTPSTSAEAKALADAAAARLGEAGVEAEGTCVGNPALRAGSVIAVTGVGTRFGGDYRLTGVTHVFRDTGFETQFSISGSASRGLLDLMAPEAPPRFGASLAIGIVTNNTDPETRGRVRVSFPGLGATIESAWARVAVPQAHAEQGLMMLPQPDDEVVVGFEGGDPRRPYVLGSVWNGAKKPGPLSMPDGSHSLVSPKAMTLTATDGPMIITDKKGDLTVKAEAGKVAQSASGEFSIEGQAVKVKAQQALTAEAMQAQIKATSTLQAEGATVTVKGSGSVIVESGGSLTLKGASITVQGTAMVRVSAPQIQLG
ncbi:MAG: hypothetical protein QOD86_1214 [Miltoncostaeaceae bacterium]|jgi:uncharacterized protein involved in type VI secretion and phage assembly|nr:hypothetical protein [Miltoncostaeaceae bacterium]